VLVGLLAVACSSAPVPRIGLAEPAHLPTLVRGVLEEHEVAAGSKDVYELRIEGRSYLELTVDQSEVDVAVTLRGLNGSPLAFVDDPGPALNERLAVIVPTAGTYLLIIAPFEPQALGGRYRVKLLELRPAGAGDEDRAAAQALLMQGRSLRFRRPADRPGALKCDREALARWQVAGDISGQVRAMVELGETEQRSGNSSEAIRWLESSLKLARAGDEEERARALFALGDVQSSEASNEAKQTALESYRQAADLWRVLGNAEGQGVATLGRGRTELDLNELPAAYEAIQQAIPLLHQAKNQLEESNAFITLQGVYLKRGDIGEAFHYVNQALKLAQEAKARPAEASALYNLSIIYKLRGELQKALNSLKEELEIEHELQNRDKEVYTLYAMGSVYYDLGDLDKAREKYEQALSLSRTEETTASRRPGLLYNIGWILFRQGQPEEAMGLFRQALTASRELKDSETMAPALHNLGVAEISQGYLQEGFSSLRQALELRKDKNPYPLAQTLRELGTAYDRLGDPDQAIGYFAESLKIARRIGAPGLVAEALYRWALLDRKRERFEEALDKIGEAVRLVESLRSGVEADDLRTSFFASKRDYYELYIDLLVRLYQRHPEGPYLRDALAASERARARGLLDLLAVGKIELQQGIAPELRRRETELSSRLSWILDQVSQSPLEGSWEPKIRQTEEEMGQFESEVRDQFPQYAGLRFPAPLDLGGTQQLLGEDTALLEYFVGREGSALFVVTREGLAAYPLPPAAEISSRVQGVRSLVERPAGLDLSEFRRQSAKLYQLLLGPAREVLAHKHSLLIAADGPLYVLPFEVLLKDEDRGRPLPQLSYLLTDHAVSYVPSASVLRGLREAKHDEEPGGLAPKAFVAFADPVSGPGPQPSPESPMARGIAAPSGSSLPRLIYSAQEVKEIAQLFQADQVKVYVGQEATKENVLGNPLVEGAQRVHFATHGYVDEVRPELSALILTPSAGSQNGNLTVADIFNMRLRADLVVLSACKTAMGKEVSGEGMVGLTRAFLYAGARTLVVSLWPVVDRTTADLMQSFYRSLGKAASKAEALRQAKLGMIRAGQADPYLWAPFILSGEPQQTH
jgi:CHAT domain-containing protein/tetratricopeptide (TPR) repeat protein